MVTSGEIYYNNHEWNKLRAREYYKANRESYMEKMKIYYKNYYKMKKQEIRKKQKELRINKLANPEKKQKEEIQKKEENDKKPVDFTLKFD